ncbi:MAG: DUF1801 domain-containing protein [Bryobacteraceae bacterium]|nr:DUF1801 domain-containing protein [Bryobacteraceae bacterium]
MQSKVSNVSAYIEESPEIRRPALHQLRTLCRDVLENCEEGMEYGMPAYKRAGQLEVGFASQKNYIALYVVNKDAVEEFREALAGCSIGKGCIRFKNPSDIDFEVVRKLLGRAVGEGSRC